MKMYQTRDTVASVRRAFSEFTHVVVNRCYRIGNPAILKTGEFADLPVFVHMPWNNARDSQVRKWRENGGVLIDASPYGEDIGERDVTIMAECPTTVAGLKRLSAQDTCCTIVNRPITWRSHNEAVLRHCAPVAALSLLRDTVKALPGPENAKAIAAASRFPDSSIVVTDQQVCDKLAMTPVTVRSMRKSIGAAEMWCVTLRIEPREPAHKAVWAQLQAMPGDEKLFHTLAGTVHFWKRAVKEMARFGNIGLRKFYVYAPFEPQYEKLEKAHRTAQADFEKVKLLVESLPDHLGGQ